jgi:hypothetical protein
VECFKVVRGEIEPFVAISCLVTDNVTNVMSSYAQKKSQFGRCSSHFKSFSEKATYSRYSNNGEKRGARRGSGMEADGDTRAWMAWSGVTRFGTVEK